MVELVLASGSPRRRELLGRLGVAVTVVVPDVDETPRPGEEPAAYVTRLARAKADAAAAELPADDPRPVVAADTTVVLDGRLLAKPADADDARAMLRSLAGRTHQVLTGVAVRLGPHQSATGVCTTGVTFAELTDERIDWYVASGEPLDKAGGYGLQGAGELLVDRVDGSVGNVVGLPLATLDRLLAGLGVDLTA